MVYLEYLAQIGRSDKPCPRFQNDVKEYIRRGWVRRRWVLFGPVYITRRGLSALKGNGG